VLMLTNTIVTTILKIVLLVFCLHATNSIFVRIYPPHNSKGECNSLTILTGPNVEHEFYKLDLLLKSSYGYDTISYEFGNSTWLELLTLILENDDQFGQIPNITNFKELNENLTFAEQFNRSLPKEYDFKIWSKYTKIYNIYNISSDDNDDILVGHNQDWFRLRDYEWFKVNENNGYRAQYAYCQDIRGFLTFPWIPILSWIVLTWLPFILLTIIQNISNLKILLDLPGIPLMSILSNFQIGPRNVNGRRYYCLSTAASVVNIVLTLASVACVIHLVTTGFGPGDGRGLRFVIPILTTLPLCLSCVLVSLALIFVSCCRTDGILYSDGHLSNGPEDPTYF